MAIVALVGLAASISGCREDTTEEVVVYVSADRQVAGPILQAFEDRTGIRVRPLYDTEATKTTGLAQRIRREGDRPRGDVFWSSEPFAVEQLAAEGFLTPTDAPALRTHPRAWRRVDDRWFAFGGRARVIVFRPDRITAEEVPRLWADLADPTWHGRLVMADPRFGTTRGHVASLAVGWGETAFETWLAGLRANEIELLPGGNAATVDAVARGEALLGLTDTDDVMAAIRRGVDVDAVLPRHESEGVPDGGTLVVPNAVGRIAGGPHPEPARALVAWLASAAVEESLRRSGSRNLPLAHPEVRERVAVGSDGRFDEPRPWRVSITEAAAAADRAVDRTMEILGGDGHPTESAP